MRSVAAFILGILVTLVVFGLAISLLWFVGPGTSSYKLTIMLISSGLAIAVGGFSIATILNRKCIIASAVFGFSFGFSGSAYVLGVDWSILAFAAAASVLAGIGGVLSLFLTRGGTLPIDLDLS